MVGELRRESPLAREKTRAADSWRESCSRRTPRRCRAFGIPVPRRTAIVLATSRKVDFMHFSRVSVLSVAFLGCASWTMLGCGNSHGLGKEDDVHRAKTAVSSGGLYSLVRQGSEKCVDVSGGSTQIGA